MSVAIDFNPLDAAFQQHPHEVYAYMRDNAPVHLIESIGAYGLFTHELCTYALKHQPKLFTARAALAETGRAHPESVSTAFFKAAVPGAAELEVLVNGTGRTLANARVQLRQEGVLVLESTVVCTDAPSGEVPADPTALPVDESLCAPPSVRPGTGPSILDSVDVRYAPGRGPKDKADPDAVVTAWVRMLTGEDPDAMICIVAADALVPTPFRLGYIGWSPTVSMTWHLRALPAPGPRRKRQSRRQRS